MAILTIVEADLEDVIRHDRWQTLRYHASYPGGALLAAIVLLPFQKYLSAIAFGGGLAWAWSLMKEVQALRPRYVSFFESLKEPFELGVQEGGLRFSGDPGESFLKWEAITAIHNYPGSFVVRDDDQIFALLPKRCLSTGDILVLESHSTSRGEWRK